jgi:hypothetical protein
MLRVEEGMGAFWTQSRYPCAHNDLGAQVEKALFHVLLDEGRKLGPYDRRTVIGMRIKKALTSDHVLEGADGARLTVAALIGQRPAEAAQPFQADRSGSFSIVQATFTAALAGVEGRELGVPAFRGEMEVRVQSGVLRIAGRYRKGLRWKQDRVKLQMSDVVHARIKGSLVDLWFRTGDAPAPLRRLSLELFTSEVAGDLVEWFPGATPWPHGEERVAAVSTPNAGGAQMLWLTGTAVLVVVTVLVVAVAVMGRRAY